ncbi:hypothetical protein MMC24_002725 [Lignoscripta atroalba]|nr:hypothetical protein [Lignoscripta atroalba]
MAAVQSQESETTQGKVDEQDMSFTFNPDGPGDLICLVSDTGFTKKIGFQDVVAVIPQKDDRNGFETARYTMLWIERSKQASGDAMEELKSYKGVTKLPRTFLEKHLVSSLPAHLSLPKGSAGTPNVHVIVSVRSGIGGAEQFFTEIVKGAFHAVGLSDKDYDVYTTTSDKSIMEWASKVLLQRANVGIAQTVLLLSGDGGIVDMVNVLLSGSQSGDYVKPTIGLLAMGTGNALANSTGLNRDSTKGLASFLRGIPHSLPTFAARFSPGSEFVTDEGRLTEPLPFDDSGTGVIYGAVVCSWALHASLVADSDTTEYRKHGVQRFQMAAKELLAPADGSIPHRFRGKITLTQKDANGDESLRALDRQEHMYILATLVSKLEEKLTISPHSNPLDGQLRLLHFGALSSEEIMRILGLAFAGGQHIQEHSVEYDNIQGLRIDFEEPGGHWRRICVDGKIIRVGEGGWVEVKKEARDVVDLVADIKT